MQNAKDTFYVTLRDRLAAVNPARTMVLRGVTRPGVLVEENELASACGPVNVFCLRWTGLSVDAQGGVAAGDDGLRDPVCDGWECGEWWDGSRAVAGGDGC